MFALAYIPGGLWCLGQRSLHLCGLTLTYGSVGGRLYLHTAPIGGCSERMGLLGVGPFGVVRCFGFLVCIPVGLSSWTSMYAIMFL
jgi:hypothetical protein